MFDDLLKIYPNAIVDKKLNDPTYLSVSIEGSFLNIPRSKLTKSEIKLLEVMDDSQKNEATASPWLDFFTQKNSLPPYTNFPVYFLYLQILGEFDFPLWENTLLSSIPELNEMIHYESTTYIGVVSFNGNNELLSQIDEIMATLDIDFEISTTGMSGQLITGISGMQEIFQSEYSLFSQATEKHPFEHITSLSKVILEIEVREAIKKLPYLHYNKFLMYPDGDIKETITVMYEKEGNLSQAAEGLFIHRNTLLYRINKFYKDTGFNLQYLPDLIICYFSLNANRLVK